MRKSSMETLHKVENARRGQALALSVERLHPPPLPFPPTPCPLSCFPLYVFVHHNQRAFSRTIHPSRLFCFDRGINVIKHRERFDNAKEFDTTFDRLI